MEITEKKMKTKVIPKSKTFVVFLIISMYSQHLSSKLKLKLELSLEIINICQIENQINKNASKNKPQNNSRTTLQ